MKMNINRFGRSFIHAWRGLRLAFKTERSFRIQIALALILVSFILVLPLTAVERALLMLAAAAVLVLELMNSTVERIADLLKPRLNEFVGDVKDLMAGAVLIASVFALLVGLIILGPRLSNVLAGL